MNNYFFLGTALPALYIDHSPQISFDQLMDLFEMNLVQSDKKKVKAILKAFDLRNIVELATQSELYPYGNLSKEDLQQTVSEQTFFDDEVFEFLAEYENPVEIRHHFHKLLSWYLNKKINETHGFLHTFFVFENQLRLVLAAYRAKKAGRDLQPELIYEDVHDPFVMQLLLQKEAATFEFPYEFKQLQSMLPKDPSPIEEMEAIAKFRFLYFDEFVSNSEFSIGALLAYMIQLINLEMIDKLADEEGSQMINQLVKEI